MSQARIKPYDALRTAVAALRGRLSIPLSEIESRLSAVSNKATLAVSGRSGGIELNGRTRALGAAISFSALITIDGVDVTGTRRLARIVIRDVELKVDDPDAPGPLAEAIRQGRIDTEHPASLIGNMVTLPDFVADASGDTVTLDLMKLPILRDEPALREAFGLASSLLGVTGVATTERSIELELGLLPGGAREAALSAARTALAPAVRYLWPEGGPQR